MKSLRHLNKYILKYKWRLLLGSVFIVTANLITAFLPSKIKEAVDGFEGLSEDYSLKESNISKELFYENEILPAAFTLIAIYFGLALLRGLFVFLQRQTIIIMSRYIEYDLKQEIYNQYQNLSQSFYKKNNTGDLMNRISEDVGKVRMYLGPAIMYTINLTSLFIITLTFMLAIDVKLTLLALIPLPLMSVLIYFVSSTINKRSEKVQKSQSKLTTIVQEAFSGIRILKAYNQQKSANSKFEKGANDYMDKSLKLVMINALFMPTILLLIGLSTTIVIYFGSISHLDGNISKGDIVQFVMYIGILTWPFASVGWVTSIIQRAAASQTRINEFLDYETEIESGETSIQESLSSIEFENVSFTYPGTGITALKNVSFKLAPNKVVALMGKTGSGKSTVADLVCRLFDPTEGKILVNNQNLKDLNLSEFRSKLGYVPQEVFLFSDSISNNIAFGDSSESISESSIKLAAKQAHIHHNIEDFKEGYQTILGERGITLSGGQKQRISIARAIIKQPELLLFDDCLSAVDTETEEVILQYLKEIMKNKCTLIISHRISSVQHADEIIILNDGSIIERGTHSELMSAKGWYNEMYSAQSSEQLKDS